MADTGGSYETLRTGLNDPRGEAAERANLGFALGRALDARGDCAAACAARRAAAQRPRGRNTARTVSNGAKTCQGRTLKRAEDLRRAAQGDRALS